MSGTRSISPCRALAQSARVGHSLNQPVSGTRSISPCRALAQSVRVGPAYLSTVRHHIPNLSQRRHFRVDMLSCKSIPICMGFRVGLGFQQSSFTTSSNRSVGQSFGRSVREIGLSLGRPVGWSVDVTFRCYDAHSNTSVYGWDPTFVFCFCLLSRVHPVGLHSRALAAS